MKLSLHKDLGPLKAEALARIDREAGEIRSRYITTSPGQEMVYLEKRREAEAYVSGAITVESELPHLYGEAQVNGISMFDQAVEYLTMAQYWAPVSAYIEATRIGSKQAVMQASSPAEIEAAMPDWNALTT